MKKLTIAAIAAALAQFAGAETWYVFIESMKMYEAHYQSKSASIL